MPAEVQRTHKFHSTAQVLGGDLRLPLVQKLVTQAHAQLPTDGGYHAQHTTGYRLEGVLSYSAGHSQVAGNPSTKPGKGWSTITTTVIEGLNVLEVLTADRVVGQIITSHPLKGYVPEITFLGTRIENLRIAGHPVHLDWDMHFLDKKPEDDRPYTDDPAVLASLAKQYERIARHKNPPTEVVEYYNEHTARKKSREEIECSLVLEASGNYPGYSWGNVIRIPHFGTIILAKVSVTHEDFNTEGTPTKTTVGLTMIDLKLGCAIDAKAAIGTGSTNGSTWP